MAKKTTAGHPKSKNVIDLSDLKTTLASHIKTAEAVVRSREASIAKAGGQGSIGGKKIVPSLLHAKRILSAMKAANLSMDACCCSEPAQTCDFEP